MALNCNVYFSASLLRKAEHWQIEKGNKNEHLWNTPFSFTLPPTLSFFLFPSVSVDSPVQKSISKKVEVAKGHFPIHCEGIARDDSFHLSIHDGSEAVRGWLWSNSATRKILLYEIPEAKPPWPTLLPPTHQCNTQRDTHINLQFLKWKFWFLPDKSCLSCWVLSYHQHHWLVVKVCVLIARRMKVMERIVFLYRQQPLIIKVLQLLCHHIDIPQCFRVAPMPPEGHGDAFLL